MTFIRVRLLPVMLCMATLAVLGSVSGLCLAADNFSQRPGFAAYFATHPPANRPAGPRDQALLRRYRPRLWVGPGQDAPIGFYPDYIAHGTLYDARGKAISAHVDRALLNRYKHAPGVTFAHRPGHYPTHPIVLARVDRARLGCTPTFTFLTYNFIFRDSGLPAGLIWRKAGPLSLIANLDDWHQLDHYTAVSVVLDAAQRPVALLLQQHNDQRSYVFGTDIERPADDRVRLIAALRSNELYPWRRGRTTHRTVQYMTPDNLRYLVTGRDKPFYAARDITQAAHEVHYKLAFLPPDDAFYVFQGGLGEKRRLPGRSGPPGADYHTLPMFMNRALQLVAFHWRPGDTRQMHALIAFLGASRAQGRAGHPDRRVPKALHGLHADAAERAQTLAACRSQEDSTALAGQRHKSLPRRPAAPAFHDAPCRRAGFNPWPV